MPDRDTMHERVMMTAVDNFTPRERAILLALATQGGAVSNPDLEQQVGLRLKGAERVRLNEANLVESERSGRAYAHQLTEDGWQVCRDMAEAGPGARASAGEKALYALLGTLGGYLERTGQQLRDLLGGPVVDRVHSADDQERVVAAYHTVASAPGEFVPLTAVRARLTSLPRTTADVALAALYRSQRANLVPESNQRTLTPDDRQAALRIGGEDKHLMAIGAS